MISIVIPTFNRVNDIKLTLDSLLDQTLTDFEILIIDNGPSTDNTEIIINNYIKKSNKIKYFKTDLKGVTYARSLGNLYAKGDIIIQVDDDITLLHNDLLDRIKYIFNTYDIDVLGATELKKQHLNKEKIDLLLDAEYSKLSYIKELEIGQIKNNYDITTGFELLINKPIGLYKVQSFRSCFMAYKKSILTYVKNFDINYSLLSNKIGFREETDFLLRISKTTDKIYLTNSLIFWHRAGIRDISLADRTKELRSSRYKATCHSYFSMKDLIDSKKSFIFMTKWFFYQMIIGGYKNPGFLRELKNKNIYYACNNLYGFIRGLTYAIFYKRKYLDD